MRVSAVKYLFMVVMKLLLPQENTSMVSGDIYQIMTRGNISESLMLSV